MEKCRPTAAAHALRAILAARLGWGPNPRGEPGEGLSLDATGECDRNRSDWVTAWPVRDTLARRASPPRYAPAMSDPSSPPVPNAAPAPLRPTRGVAVTRLLLAHLLSIPLALGCAIAAIPPAIHLSWESLVLIDDMQAVGMFLVRRIAYPAAVAFVIPHILVIPWMVGRDSVTYKRFFTIAILALYAGCVASGIAGWVWLHVRGD